VFLPNIFWQETPIRVEEVVHLFFSRDLLLVVLKLLCDAGRAQLWVEQLGAGPDGTLLRSVMINSDDSLEEEAHGSGPHGSLSLDLEELQFMDESVVSSSGEHYMYPILARVLNVRDRAVQWVTVGYVSHVGKLVARTAAARRRASHSRNRVLQRYLAVFIRRCGYAIQAGVPVEFPGQSTLSAVPRLSGHVTDQLAERSVFCLMGNECEFLFSQFMVLSDVAGGATGVGVEPCDVTAVLETQLDGAVARDRDLRNSLRYYLRNEYNALAFVPAIGAVWGLATDNKNIYKIISFDLLHVWKMGNTRMVAHRCLPCLRVACYVQDARLGPLGETLEALHLRAWEMVHLNVSSPKPPGYVGSSFSVPIQFLQLFSEISLSCGIQQSSDAAVETHRI